MTTIKYVRRDEKPVVIIEHEDGRTEERETTLNDCLRECDSKPRE